jgi:hypothetical protein
MVRLGGGDAVSALQKLELDLAAPRAGDDEDSGEERPKAIHVKVKEEKRSIDRKLADHSRQQVDVVEQLIEEVGGAGSVRSLLPSRHSLNEASAFCAASHRTLHPFSFFSLSLSFHTHTPPPAVTPCFSPAD